MKLLPANIATAINAGSRDVTKWAKKNAPAILIGIGDVLWAGATAWGIFKSPEMRDQLRKVKKKEKKDTSVPEKVWNRTKAIAPCLGSVLAMGASGTACHIAAQKEASKRLAAVAAAYAISESKRKTLEEKTKEVLGAKEAEKVQEEIRKETVEANAEAIKGMPTSLPNGNVLMIDEWTGNFGYTTSEEVYHAGQKILARLPYEEFVELNEFFWEIGFANRGAGTVWGFTQKTGAEVAVEVDKNTGVFIIKYDCAIRPDYI